MILVSAESFRPGRVHETLVQTLVIKESKIDFEKNLRPSKHLRAKNEFSRKHDNYTVRIVVR